MFYKIKVSISIILFIFTISLFGQDHDAHNHEKSIESSVSEKSIDPETNVDKTQKNNNERNPKKESIEILFDNSGNEKKEKSSVHHTHPNPLAMPAGLMLPHVHNSNDWMVDYLYMQMDMRSIYNGGNIEDPYKYLAGIEYNPTVGTIPSRQANTGMVHNHNGVTSNSTTPDPFPSYYISSLNPNPYRYMSMPISMKMEMTMISLMKNISNSMAIMIMLPYINNSMEMVSGNLEKSFMRTQGIGDVGATLAYKVFEKDSHKINLQFGITLPTGSIDEKNQMPLMGKLKSPYNMQLGTGTYNTIPGISYIYTLNKLTLGGFGQITLRNGKNDNGYRFGNRYEFSVWTSYALLSWLSPTLRVTSTKWDNISGADSSIDPTMDPQNDPNRQGGRRIDLLAGLNFFIPSLSEKMKAGLEVGKPVYQHLNGPQMGASTLVNFRFQTSF